MCCFIHNILCYQHVNSTPRESVPRRLYMPLWDTCFLDVLYFAFPRSCPQALRQTSLL